MRLPLTVRLPYITEEKLRELPVLRSIRVRAGRMGRYETAAGGGGGGELVLNRVLSIPSTNETVN